MRAYRRTGVQGQVLQYSRRTHGRVVHVFQGRYKAILVEKDSYLLELARYVVLNPVATMQRAAAGQMLIGEIPRLQRGPIAQPLSHYRERTPDAKAAMAAAYATGDYTMQQIAECFGVHYATVSRAVTRKAGKCV